MALLSIGVLGSLQVSIADMPLTTLESVRVRALLAYLAVESDRPHRRETLVGLLWPDYPEDAARHNLRQALFNLRLILGDHTANPPYLFISHDAIQFNRESDYSLDLDQFNNYFYTCEENLSQCKKDCSTHASRLEEMVKLYRGEFLQQFFLEDSTEYEEWAVLQRENLHQHVLEAHSYLANYYELKRDYKDAHQHALRQLELDPWREEAHRQMMRVLALNGQRSAAIVQYETCKQVLAKELDVEPSAETKELYEQIRLGTLSPKTEQVFQDTTIPLHNLPIQLTPFIGREVELARLDQLIADPECRCITLVGPGGMGKTRLAVQAAEKHLNEFAQGGAFVPLASVGSISEVIPAIGNAIKFTFFGPSDPKEYLLSYLHEKQMLLVLDNLEHLLIENSIEGNIADLLIEILRQAPGIKLLVTSREALNLQEEFLFEVPGLAFPDMEQVKGLDGFDAMTLFAQRARHAFPKFGLNAENQREVARICRLVEGMPLAIELAATWMRTLSPAEIAVEIESSLDFLGTTMRDLPVRHRSMRAVFDHSWKLLTEEEQRVVLQLSVFQGGFMREAAVVVTGATLSTLSNLVTKSIIRRSGSRRYDLHELIRQFSVEHFTEQQVERPATQMRHGNYFLTYFSQANGRLGSSRQKEALSELTDDMDNFRVAWDWALVNGEFTLIEHTLRTFAMLYDNRGWYQEGLETLDRAIHALETNHNPSQPDRTIQISLAHILTCRAYIAFRLTQVEQAQEMLERSLEILQPLNEPQVLVESLTYLGLVMIWTGNYTRALELLTEGLTIATTISDRWFSAVCLTQKANIIQMMGDSEMGHTQLQSAVAMWRAIGDFRFTAYALNLLSLSALALGQYAEARASLEECVELNISVGDRWGLGLGYQRLGRVAQAQDLHNYAIDMFTKGFEIFTELGARRDVARVLAEMGRSLFALGNDTEARQVWLKAIQIASETQGAHVALEALVGIARLLAKQGHLENALELLLIVMNNSASVQETKACASHLQAEVEAQLAKPQIDTTVARVQSKTFEAAVEEVLKQSI